MSSILKVDTIQDQSGNNIINELGNVITIGASGDTITVPAGATLSGDLTGITNLTMTGDLTVDTNTLKVDSTNNYVGIGTASPSAVLHVDASGGAFMKLERTGQDHLYLSTDGTNGLIRTSSATGALRFQTNVNNERMRIDSSGNVLVGKTSASTANVGIQLTQPGSASFTSDNAIPLIANRKTTDGDIIVVRKDNSTVGKIGNISTNNFFIGTEDAGFTFRGSIPDIVPSDFGANRDNLINLGTNTARWKNLYLGGGLYVGGTGTANKLDDYEEGTFTPSFSDAGGGSYQYSTQTGNYTKIGNTVFISGYLITSGTFRTGGSGNVLLNGLPFAMTTGGFGSIDTLHSYGSWGDTPLGAEIASSGTSSNIFYRDTADGNRQRLQASDISTSAYVLMQFTGFYKTA